MNKQSNNKKGRPYNLNNICRCCNKEFETAKKKCTHEFKMKIKKSKTEVGSITGERDTKIEDVLETPKKKNIFTLGDNGAFSKFKQLYSAVKTVELKNKVLISTAIGPNSILNPEDILMEKESSEE
jgi:hypothetical protein